jgi:hypothetical protein
MNNISLTKTFTSCATIFGIIAGSSIAIINPAQAGLISDFRGGIGIDQHCKVTDLNEQIDNNNNNVGAGNPNEVVCSKTFTPIDTYIDSVFEVIPSNAEGGVTEYIFKETVINNTGNTWTDFHFELGFGIGGGFKKSNLTDFLDFDVSTVGNNPSMEDNNGNTERDPIPTSNKFSQLMHQANNIWWDIGQVPNGESVDFTFSIDVPDFNNSMPDSAKSELGYRFTLRERPSTEIEPIPEPLTILGSATALGFGAFFKRKLKPSQFSEKETTKVG